MIRQQRSLAGVWQFQVDADGSLTVDTLTPDREITVPLPWQAAFPELERYSGYAWYRTEIILDDSWLGGQLLLKFGAVDYWCQVFVNGQLAGEHEGGYTPFTLPVRAYAQPGVNQIAVRVYDPVQTGLTIERWPQDVTASRAPFDAVNVPHGKQEWYINVGGLWQDVTLIAVPQVYLDSVRVTTDIYSGEVRLRVRLTGMLGTGELAVTVGDVTATAALTAGQSEYELALTVEAPQWWSPDQPTLYTAVVRLTAPGMEDVVKVRFGFREISTRDGQLLLNGAPIYLRSALDQDYYPETIYTVPSEAYLRDEFEKAKALGFNNLRCHIKPPDPLYLDLADELGLLIWAEIPSWRTFHVKPSLLPDGADVPDAVRDRARHTLAEMIERDFNHPSLVIWTIVNEDWGTATALSARDRQWLVDMYDLCRQLDPTRLVVDNSACMNSWGPNLHVKSDLDDFHVYANIPDQAGYFEQMIRQISLRPLWTYSHAGDAVRTGHEPLILSEFGNWGLPSLSAYQGEEPKWFHLGAWWSAFDGLPGWPRGVVKRFKQLGLTAIWPDYEAFATAAQWHQFQALKFEIETMRRHNALQGYVLTELTDVYWESNGVLDFNRGPKAFHEVLSTVNAPDVIVPQPERYAYWDDQTMSAGLYVSHYSGRDWAGSRLRWRLGAAQGETPVPAVERGAVSDLGTYQWTFAPVEQATTARVEFQLDAADGSALAQNTLDVLVLPSTDRIAAYQGAVTVVTPPRSEENLLTLASRLGYRASSEQSAAQIMLTDEPTAEALAWVRAGGAMLFLSSGPSPFFWCQSRGGTYGGGWINNYSWLRPGVHRRLATSSPLTLPFREIMPGFTIMGLPVEDENFQADFLAGQISGWVQLPAVHTVQFRYGAGKVIMTTFSLERALQQKPADPMAAAMLHDLVDYLASDACQPRLTGNY